jgi:hypothetical protein
MSPSIKGNSPALWLVLVIDDDAINSFSTSFMDVQPVSTTQESIPAAFAKAISVSSLSPTIKHLRTSTSISIALLSSLKLLLASSSSFKPVIPDNAVISSLEEAEEGALVLAAAATFPSTWQMTMLEGFPHIVGSLPLALAIAAQRGPTPGISLDEPSILSVPFLAKFSFISLPPSSLLFLLSEDVKVEDEGDKESGLPTRSAASGFVTIK